MGPAGQTSASQSHLAGSDGKGDGNKENSPVDFSKVQYTAILVLLFKCVYTCFNISDNEQQVSFLNGQVI